MVTNAAAFNTLGAYQISVVEPPVPTDCDARDHVAPVCAILVTLPLEVPRVEITAIIVFPLAGAADIVTAMVVAAAAGVAPVANRTRVGVVGV